MRSSVNLNWDNSQAPAMFQTDLKKLLMVLKKAPAGQRLAGASYQKTIFLNENADYGILTMVTFYDIILYLFRTRWTDTIRIIPVWNCLNAAPLY